MSRENIARWRWCALRRRNPICLSSAYGSILDEDLRCDLRVTTPFTLGHFCQMTMLLMGGHIFCAEKARQDPYGLTGVDGRARSGHAERLL